MVKNQITPPRHARSPQMHVSIIFPDQGRTKQSEFEESQINVILAKYIKTGVIQHVNNHQPAYGDITQMDFQQSMETILKGQEMFEELPAQVRKNFNHDPAEFLEYVNDPENLDKLYDMGVTNSPLIKAESTSPDKPAEGKSEAKAKADS